MYGLMLTFHCLQHPAATQAEEKQHEFILEIIICTLTLTTSSTLSLRINK